MAGLPYLVYIEPKHLKIKSYKEKFSLNNYGIFRFYKKSFSKIIAY